jgi:hypothetical protein
MPRRYFDHALSGEWVDHRDCHIKPDLVLIYRKPDAASLELVRLGSRRGARELARLQEAARRIAPLPARGRSRLHAAGAVALREPLVTGRLLAQRLDVSPPCRAGSRYRAGRCRRAARDDRTDGLASVRRRLRVQKNVRTGSRSARCGPLPFRPHPSALPHCSIYPQAAEKAEGAQASPTPSLRRTHEFGFKNPSFSRAHSLRATSRHPRRSAGFALSCPEWLTGLSTDSVDDGGRHLCPGKEGFPP